MKIVWQKTKRLLEFLAYATFDTLALAFCPKKPVNQQIAIVNCQLLGDYVLWLPYGRALIRHKMGEGFSITFVLLNKSVISLVQAEFPDATIIAINKNKFLHNPISRWRTLHSLRSMGVTAAYHTAHPRGSAILPDALVRALGKPAWGFDSVPMDRPWLDQVISRKIYTNLVPPRPDIHQALHHLTFTHSIGVCDAFLSSTTDCWSNHKSGVDNEGLTMVLAPGASEPGRRWPVQHFISVTRRLIEQHPGLRVIVVGTEAERYLGEEIANTLGNTIENQAGQTDVLELVNYIAHAQLLLGNDSGAGHIAAACGTPSVVVVGGGHYGRCFPYDPAEARVAMLPTTVTQPMDCFGCDWLCRYKRRESEPFRCIEAIHVEPVLAAARQLLF